jgi:hypothetical protein
MNTREEQENIRTEINNFFKIASIEGNLFDIKKQENKLINMFSTPKYNDLEIKHSLKDSVAIQAIALLSSKLSVTGLYIDGCDLRDEGVATLAWRIPQSVTNLGFTNNRQITDRGRKIITRIVKTHKNIIDCRVNVREQAADLQAACDANRNKADLLLKKIATDNLTLEVSDIADATARIPAIISILKDRLERDLAPEAIQNEFIDTLLYAAHEKGIEIKEAHKRIAPLTGWETRKGILVPRNS